MSIDTHRRDYEDKNKSTPEDKTIFWFTADPLKKKGKRKSNIDDSYLPSILWP